MVVEGGQDWHGFQVTAGFFSQICTSTVDLRLATSMKGDGPGLGNPCPHRRVYTSLQGLWPWGFQDAPFYLLVLGFDRLPLWGTVFISVGCAVLCALTVWFFVCPRMKRKIERK